jgi:hypothetical protein
MVSGPSHVLCVCVRILIEINYITHRHKEVPQLVGSGKIKTQKINVWGGLDKISSALDHHEAGKVRDNFRFFLLPL